LVADPGAANLVKIEPTPGETFLILDEIADLIVDSLKDLPRLELLLFENVREFMFLKYVNLVGRDEDRYTLIYDSSRCLSLPMMLNIGK